MSTSRIADSVGRVLGGRYRLTRPLGVGASAHVFAAEDVQLRRRVAVKVLHPALAGEEAFLRRFRREAQAVAGLRHASILRVYDWGEEGGAPYLVMELLEGGSLRGMLDRGVLLSPAQAAGVGAAAARALAYAHGRGIVHRDIKPANLIFDDEGRLSVADFGLARALAEATLTEPSGAMVGTARYASPELVRGEKLDAKADVYSLAIVLVEAITGQVPFAADTAIGTLMARVSRPLTVPDATGALRPVLEAAGHLHPEERLDAAGLVSALDAVAASLPPPAPLSLAGPWEAGVVERDDASPTEYPGRPRLFDAEAAGVAEVSADRPDRADSGSRPGAPARTLPSEVPGGDSRAAEPGHVGGQRTVPPGPAGDDRDARDDPPSPGPAPPPRGRRWRILGAVVAVLVLLAGAAAAWGAASGRFTPEHPVPVVVGRSQAVATSVLHHLHLRLTVAGSDYNGRFSAGTVISQQPRTGKLKEGSSVSVVLSLGPQPVPVPNLANDSQQAAEQVIASLGLKVGQVIPKASMTVGDGLVIANNPDSGTVLPGAPVDLVVSTGKPQVPVPALSPADGGSYAAAAAALSAAGLGATESDSYSDTVAAGQVMAFAPGPGTSVTVGTVVTVEVSKGPHMVAVPDVRNMSVGAATQAISAAGLGVSGVQGNPLSTVTASNPPAGQSVHFGSSVQLVTS